MSVKELIEALAGLPPEALVMVYLDRTYYDCIKVVPDTLPDPEGYPPEVYLHAAVGYDSGVAGCTGQETFD
jgi:hypothetical protein